MIMLILSQAQCQLLIALNVPLVIQKAWTPAVSLNV